MAKLWISMVSLELLCRSESGCGPEINIKSWVLTSPNSPQARQVRGGWAAHSRICVRCLTLPSAYCGSSIVPVGHNLRSTRQGSLNAGVNRFAESVKPSDALKSHKLYLAIKCTGFSYIARKHKFQQAVNPGSSQRTQSGPNWRSLDA